MLNPVKFLVRLQAGASLVLALFFAADASGAGETELAAAAVLGKGDAAVLQLVREVTDWKSRAEAAEGLLLRSGVQLPVKPSPRQLGQAKVVGSVEEERVLIVSAGRLSGAVLGCLLNVGDGVLAKVVESRETVSAAMVEQRFKGRLGQLEGSPVSLFVARP
jgi:hypothetical protein